MRMAWTGLTAVAGVAVLLAVAPARAQEDENPHTPGAIPNPGTYQGSMQLQHQQDYQDQQFRQQQQQQQQPPPPQQYYGQPQAPGYAPRSGRGVGMAPGADVAAFRRGDYATAYRLSIGNASHGDRVAQHNIGMLYEQGLGTPRNYAQAAVWYRRAAERGAADGANDLARLYTFGYGVPRDHVQAYVWFSRAAGWSSGKDRAVILDNRRQLIAKMTPAEFADAQRAVGGGGPRHAVRRRR